MSEPPTSLPHLMTRQASDVKGRKENYLTKILYKSNKHVNVREKKEVTLLPSSIDQVVENFTSCISK